MATLNSSLKQLIKRVDNDVEIAQDIQAKVISFQESATQFESNARRVGDLGAKLTAQSEPTEGGAPPQLIEEFDNLRGSVNGAINTIESILVFVEHRFPEIKIEDNVGVEICSIVAKKLAEIQTMLEGGDEKKRFASVNAKAKYLKARCDLEKTLQGGTPAEGAAAEGKTKEDADGSEKKKESPTPPPPSTKPLLRQLDLDAASEIVRSWRVLDRVALQVALLVARNFTVLNQPRKASGGFVS